MKRIHLKLYGSVQGVGFRAFARSAAARSGIDAGWVKNCTDGSVELEAEGAEDAITGFTERVSRGPLYAHVERVDELPVTGNPLPSPFAIVR